MVDLSVVIPARHEKYLAKTILDILAKAVTRIEIIVVLDGYWEPSENIIVSDRVKYIHNGQPLGMRESINRSVAIASGKYLLKCDAHVMFAHGFDRVLIDNHRTRRVQVPTRKRLDPKKWAVIDGSDINYLRMDGNYRGVLDKKKNGDPKLNSKKIDRIDAFQGSCWFMRTRAYQALGLLDAENWGPMGHESQEIYFKVTSNHGNVVRNKHTWYAHWHKEKKDLTFKSDRSKSRKYIQEYLKSRNQKGFRVQAGIKRRDLAKRFSGIGAEIGVRTGAFSEVICKIGKDIKLFSVDPYALPYRDKRSNAIGMAEQEKFFQDATKRLAPYDCKILRQESMVAVLSFQPESLDFVYIDGSHEFDYVMCDIIEWAKRVKPGGIVAGHDYYRFRDADVVTAVDTYCRVHGIDFKLTEERTPSWWFIKQ